MTGMVALYIFMLAAFTGYEVISRVPVILHTPLMSGSNFVHGIVLVGAMVALGGAHTTLEKVIGFIGVSMAAGNAAGRQWLIQVSYLVTAFLFIMGLKRMSSPVTARSGIVWAGAGMLVATLFTFLFPGIQTDNYWLIMAAIALG